MISITCSSCQKKLIIKDDLVGKKVKCPGCAQVITVPLAQKVAAPITSEETLPPRTAAQEQPTTPPQDSPSASLQTAPSLSMPDVTQSPNPDSDDETSLTDFLAPKQSDDELGRLGKFRILKILGHGGMGVVFMGEDSKLNRKVAIKAMLPHLAQSRTSQQRFLREARSAAALEHDHIVPILQVDEDRGAPYIVMPFLQGEPLDKTLQREEKLPIAEVLRIGRETAEGLAAAHERGLIHRDIKPANLWLEGKKARVKILDFGLARAATQDSGLTQQGAIVGTPSYMAPEQARGDTIDERCDLWALGVVLYRLCTGKQPFLGKDTVSTLMAVAMQDPQAPHELNAEIPAELSNLVMNLLAKDPEKRLGKAEDVVAQIRKLEKDLALAHDDYSRTHSTAIVAANMTQRPTESIAVEPPSRRRHGLFVGLACGLLALLVAGVVFFWQSPNGLVRIEIEDDDIEVLLTKTGVKLKKADGDKDITLAAGSDHRIKVTRGDDFAFETNEFVLKKGDKITVSVKVEGGKVIASAAGKEIGAKELPPAVAVAPGNFALEFDGGAYVQLPVMKAKVAQGLNARFTLEAWAKPTAVKGEKAKLLPGNYVFHGQQYNSGLFIHPSMKWAGKVVMQPLSQAEDRAELDRPVRVALTFDGEFQRLFIDGKLAAANNLDRSTFFNGPISIGNCFIGVIDDIRISNVCRYTADYTPGRPEKDKDTVALYHCDEGQGDVLIDSSGNGHHGKIVGAKWVKVNGAPINAGTDYALLFESRDRLGIPSLILDPSKPFTLEGYVTQTKVVAGHQKPINCGMTFIQCQLGSIDKDLLTWSFQTRSENVTHGLTAPAIRLNEKTHVAGVYDGNELRFFVNGRMAGKKAVKNERPAKSSGNALTFGLEFTGILDEVHISKVARYDKDFQPTARLEPDADTLALYHFDEGQGDVLKDSSGNGHHGKIVGAKWVQGESQARNIATGYALQYDGNSKVEVSSFDSLPLTGNLTLEAFVIQTNKIVGGNRVFAGIHDQCSIFANPVGWSMIAQKSGLAVNVNTPVILNRRVHLAGVKDGKTLRLYVDGKKVDEKAFDSDTLRKGSGKLFIGEIGFSGQLDEVRISKVARYHNDFTPAQRYENDPDTLALYHFDEGQGDVLTDSSGNGHHGKITGAKWVRSDEVLKASSSVPGIELTRNARVDLGGLKIDTSAPYTIEATITPEVGTDEKEKGSRVILASYKHSNLLQLDSGELEFRAEGLKVKSATPLVPGKAVHAACVFDGKQLLLFLDGRPIDSRSGTLNELGPNSSSYHLGSPTGAFIGRVAEVRFSRIARYDKDFTPQPRFAPDADTLALYHCDEGQGTVLTDSSGNGHHGKIVGAKWVKADVTEIDPDRRAALWVLSIGGEVGVNGDAKWISDAGALPAGPFHLTNIRCNEFAKVTDEGLATCRGLRHLTQLYIIGSPITDAGLAHFRDCTGLTDLQLGECRAVTDAGLAHFKDCAKLTCIHIKHMPAVTDAGLAHLPVRPDLERLILWALPKVTNAALARFRGCVRLKHLQLYGLQITDAGLENFKDCVSIIQLHLGRNKITDAGLVHFMQCKDLNQLGLDQTAVGDKSVEVIKRFTNLSSGLMLGQTQITDSGLSELASLTQLRLLILKGTKVSEAAVKKLAAALPKCRIEYDGGVIEPTASMPGAPVQSAHALQFEGQAHVQIPGVKLATDREEKRDRHGQAPFL